MKKTTTITKRFRKADGTIMYIRDNKLHNWDGPAIIMPDGSKEYHLNGIQKTEDEWKEAIRNKEGLPYFKQPQFKTRF